MKLYWSTRSPFARKVMVAAHELGLADRIERVPTLAAMDKPNAELMRHNPLSKIPTLVLDDGAVLYDSFVICTYLNTLADTVQLFPTVGDDRITALRLHALGNGLLDLLVLRRNERDRPPGSRSEPHLQAFAAKTEATLDALEQEAGLLARRPVDIGHIAIGCALSYLDFRFADDDWRQGRAALAHWHEGFDSRPSMVATRPSLT
jgi:glutathione S-transferase